MKFRVNAKYAASITIDVIADSVEEAENKAREVFEACDQDDFSIGDELEIDAEPLVGVECPDCIDEPAEPGQLGQMVERELVTDLTRDGIYIDGGDIMVDMGIDNVIRPVEGNYIVHRPVEGNNIVQ